MEQKNPLIQTYSLDSPQQQPQQGYYSPYGDAAPSPYGQPTTANQQYQPPPPQQYNGSYEYNYDPYNINYSRMSVQQWNTVSADPSPYSQYWNSPQSFQPQQFAENTKRESTCNDKFWAILFYINFIATIILLICLIAAKKPEEQPQPEPQPTALSSSSKDDEEITSNMVARNLFLGLVLGFLLNVLHFCYASFAPYVYVKFGLFVGVVVSIIMAFVSFFIVNSFLFFIMPGFFILIALISYCIMREYIPLSAAVLKQTCAIIRKYPSIIALCLLQAFFDILINVMYGAIIFLIVQKEWNYAVYIYVIFSYYWVSLCFAYVTYMTGAGLGASWYFLNNTVYFPSSPVWQSFKRAMTTSFGSASLAAFLLAVIEAMKALARNARDSDNSAIQCLGCIAMCLISCLEAIVSWMSHYALIYCAIYGIPYKEGCRRWTELSCKKFVDVMIEGCVISNSLTYNFFLFTIGGALLGYGIGYIWGYASGVLVCVFALLFVLCIYIVYEQPILTITDTLFICFAEAPEKLQSSASELYDTFVSLYDLSLGNRIKRSRN